MEKNSKHRGNDASVFLFPAVIGAARLKWIAPAYPQGFFIFKMRRNDETMIQQVPRGNWEKIRWITGKRPFELICDQCGKVGIRDGILYADNVLKGAGR